ncbi:glycoside hydrolase family 9 protein [Gramella sp. GC03-9]|uniref:Glycoside hydrolase family 9 protein n=1 Tax=Christiangramia oceanisediminis TaxID=2920386 RepID=A0A9X2I7H0_9FLAO|nr:glycoside hydrolase family 9 protein [Gramella oceanisediminis]MCP9199104.1 glycoside hydrolase family 9 protein [Gramella oceanisediminis]
MKHRLKLLPISLILLLFTLNFHAQENNLELNEAEYFEAPGVNILAFSNWYNGLFSDSKISGIEIIQQGVRTATNGDVRLHSTPEQWDDIPTFSERKVDVENNSIDTYQHYPEFDFEYMIRARAEGRNLYLSVHLEKPLPEELKGRAGLNLEFLPSAYWEKTYYMDEEPGIFPLYPADEMLKNDQAVTAPKAISSGNRLVLAPDDKSRMVDIQSMDQNLMLFDGRNKAQNGWYVVRSLLPGNRTGKVLEWKVTVNSTVGWTRKPVIAHSQVGYHPKQQKVAVIELDRNDKIASEIELQRINRSGERETVISGKPERWGEFTRYQYYKFDFSGATDSGLYSIKYGDVVSDPFPIDTEVYNEAWHPTNDIFFPVQMDHMIVNEAYRVWHGASHLDDALQAPVSTEHFDLYAQGPTTDTPYSPGEHIPGLNVGGWYDAGDYDIRTQTQYHVVNNLVHAYEDFNLNRDQTLVDYEAKYVDIHNPDGKPDVLQQIQHGTLALVAQFDAVGHAIPGIIVPDISQYTHLGDGLTMTDNLIYDKELGELEVKGNRSGKFDDRWAFTSKSSALNYGSIAALAAASRVLGSINDTLAEKSLKIARKVWEDEQSSEPSLFRHGNTTGGDLNQEEFKAAVELLISTRENTYARRIEELWPKIDSNFAAYAQGAIRIYDLMSTDFQDKLKNRALQYKEEIKTFKEDNPFGVPIGRGGWAGNGQVINFGITNYLLHKKFPEIIDENEVFQSLNYIYGTHPDSSISFVSGVGTRSKKVAYGMNRADFSFISGGIVPGILILKPDFPENKEDWPFLWGENEYVVNVGASYIYLVNAVNSLLEEVE